MKKFILLSLLVVSQVLGDVWLSRGMRQVGEVNTLNPLALLGFGMRAIANPWIWLGVAFLIGTLILYLTAVSKLDLSYVLPMTSSNYVLNALFAWLLLGEKISATRWAGTLAVAIGVLIVGWGESKPSSKQKVKNSFLYLLPFTFYLSKTWLAVIAMVLTDSAGDILLAKGMKQVGEVKIMSAPQLLGFVRSVILNRTIIYGVLCLTISFFLFIALLSWADLSFVRPANALGYAASVLGAGYILKEKLTTERLIGTVFICIGVAWISLSAGIK